MYLLPGQPFIGDRPLSADVLAKLKAQYGLDKPMWQRYLLYLGNVLKGDFGTSSVYKDRTVTSIIWQTFPVSADLGIRALLFALFFGVILGTVSALYRNHTADRVCTGIAVIGLSFPSFILGTILQYLFGIVFSGWFKQTFHTDFQVFPLARWESFRYTILPTITLGLGAMSSITE